jgi:ABC-2 type transport system permease protein
MSNWAQIGIIARREFVERSRSRVFVFSLLGLSVLVIAGFFVASSIGGEELPLQIGIGGNRPDGISEDIEAAAMAIDRPVVITSFGPSEAAVLAVEAGDVDAALVDGVTIVSNRAPGADVVAILTAAANAAVRREIAAELGLTEGEVTAIVAPVQMQVEELDPEDPEEIARTVASFLSAIVLLTTIMLFGQFVAMGIIEEKQNRVVEVVLSKVEAASMMVGKVIGIGALGLVQVGALGLAAVVGLMLAPIDRSSLPSITEIGVTAALWLAVWFLLGYLVYSFLYGTLGATLSRQEDMQSIAFIPALMILPAYFLVSFSLSSPGSNAVIRTASFVPIWSPILMPFRINTEDVEPWEVGVAVTLVVLTTVLLVRVGARVYRGAALRTSSKVSLRQAWRAADE